MEFWKMNGAGNDFIVVDDRRNAIPENRWPEIVRVRAQDRDGNWFEVEDEGLTARCFCHEIEHLDGHLFSEHCDRLLTDEELEQYIREQEKELDEE